MIRVHLQDPPPHYNQNPPAAGVPWALANNYRQVLYRQLGNRCSFLAISFDAESMRGMRTVDHFMPRLAVPEAANLWRNYRLCHDALNGSFPDDWPGKGNFLLDPALQHWHNNWFYLSRATGKYSPSTLVPDAERARVQSTCGYLNKFTFPEQRLRAIDSFRHGRMTIQHLEQYYPGIHYALNVFPH